MTIVLARDIWSGGDDADIAGRIPDGGSTFALAVGVWRNLVSGFVANIVSGVLVDDAEGFWYVVACDDIPGIGDNHGSRIIAQFLSHPSMDGGGPFDTHALGLAVRYQGDEDVYDGYEFNLDDLGNWWLYLVHGGSYTTLVSGTLSDVCPTLTDIDLYMCAVGPVIKVYKDGVLVVCYVDGTVPAGGSPGITCKDGGLADAGAIVSRFDATTGCPETLAAITGHIVPNRNLAWRENVTSSKAMKNLAFRDGAASGNKIWGYKNNAWRLVSQSDGTPTDDSCGVMPGYPIYGLVQPEYSDYVYGPDGAGAAAIQFDILAHMFTPIGALAPGGIMCCLDMDQYYDGGGATYSPGYYGMYTPGLGGVNKLSGSLFHTVSLISTPSDVYGVTAPRRWWKLMGPVTIDLSCLLTIDEHYLLWQDAAMAGTSETLDVGPGFAGQFGALTADGGSWAYRLNMHTCAHTGGLPTTGVDFAKPATPASSAGAGFNGFPGQLPRTGMSAGSGGTAVANAKYIANLMQSRFFNDGGATHWRYRYGVIYSVPGSCGIALLNWVDGIETTYDLNPCVPVSGDVDGSSLSLTVPEAWIGQHEIYATAKDSGDIYVLDPDALVTLRTISTDMIHGRGMCYDIMAPEDYVYACGGDRVVKINRKTDAIVWTTVVGSGCHSLFFYHDYATSTDKLFVSDESLGQVHVLNAASGAVLHHIAVGSEPHDMARAMEGPYENKMYVCNTGDNTLTVFDPDTYAVERTLTTYAGPWGIVWDRIRQVMWVSHITDQVITAVV